MKPLIIAAFAATLALAAPTGAAAEKLIPDLNPLPGSSPFEAVGPVFAGIVGVGVGAGATSLILSVMAPTVTIYPFAVLGAAAGGLTGWSIYKNNIAPALVRAPGPKLAEAPSLLQLVVEVHE